MTAGLARKYGEEALNILVAIMKDTRAPAAAQIDAAREILNRGEGRVQRSNEPLEEPAPPSASLRHAETENEKWRAETGAATPLVQP